MERLLKVLLIIVIIQCCCLCRRYPDYLEIKDDTILEVEVDEYQNERGAAILNKTYILPAFCPMVIDSNETWKRNISIFKKGHTRPVPLFGDVKTPYILLKKKKGKYIQTIKNKDTLKFEIVAF